MDLIVGGCGVLSPLNVYNIPRLLVLYCMLCRMKRDKPMFVASLTFEHVLPIGVEALEKERAVEAEFLLLYRRICGKEIEVAIVNSRHYR